MIRLLISFFYNIKFDIIFIILILALLGFIYGSMVALSQIDIKKIIAYSSIAHMNFSLFGLFSNSLIGVSGMLFLMIGHAITSSALFLGVGVLYDRYKTRLIFYYGSLAIFMPLFALLYFISILSNFGFPGTINFVGEFLILVGSFEFSNVIIFISTFAMILSLMYSLFLYNRIFFGILQETFIRFYSDCTRLEFMILFIFFLLIIFFGLFPNLILNLSILSIIKILLV
jgi:NADH:ubiquinone oxidoreductase subunit 4 (subunit M)